jgi:4-amino-4-deoxy-L-arabinose transferase-like glycosyltransferase
MWIRRTLFGFDALVVAVLVYFFVAGLQYGAQPSYFASWLPLLVVPLAILAGAWSLARRGRTRVATALLAVLAIAPIGFVAFFGMLLILNPRWN